MVRLLSTYEQVKRERRVIDFEDVLLYTVGLLAEHRQVADAVRGQYHHFVVDEYQDVSPLQQPLLDLWLGDRDELCVVGDANQTIYTFAGATARLPARLPRSGTRGAARCGWCATTARRRRWCTSPTASSPAARPAGAARLELVAQRPPGPEPDLRRVPDEPAEATAVADPDRRR